MKTRCSAKNSQRGSVVALFVIGLVAIIAMAGLALDMSHAYVDKTRLQNALDAGALSGAMTLITSGGLTGSATPDAVLSFQEALKGTELAGLTPDVEYLATLESTVDNNAGPFVRVKLRDDGDNDPYGMTTWLLNIIGRKTIDISGSAVAGPAAAETCNLAPFVVCGKMEDEEGNPTDCFEGDSDECYGFDVWNGEEGEEQECYLKGCAPGGGDCNTDLEPGDQCGAQLGTAPVGGGSSKLGTGSFYLARIPPGCSGSNCIKESLKDSFEYCYTPGEPIYPKTGDNVSAVRYYNTKFGEYEKNVKNVSRTDYPPDEITTTDSPGGGRLYFDEYKQLQNNPSYPKTNGGKPNKRVFGVIIADCRNPLSGSSAPIDVAAIGCFFGTQPAADGGNSQVVWGEFLGKDVPACLGTQLTTSPTTVSQKIILYKDAESGDS